MALQYNYSKNLEQLIVQENFHNARIYRPTGRISQSIHNNTEFVTVQQQGFGDLEEQFKRKNLDQDPMKIAEMSFNFQSYSIPVGFGE